MFLVYKPEGQPEQRWHFQPGRVRTGSMILLQKVTGLKYGQEFKQALLEGDVIARRALLWLHLRQDHPTIRVEDVEFADDELLLVQDKDELVASIEQLENMTGIPEDERAAGLSMMRQQLLEAPDAPGKAPTVTPAGPEPAPEPTPGPTPVSTPIPDPIAPAAASTPLAAPAASNGYATSTGLVSASS